MSDSELRTGLRLLAGMGSYEATKLLAQALGAAWGYNDAGGYVIGAPSISHERRELDLVRGELRDTHRALERIEGLNAAGPMRTRVMRNMAWRDNYVNHYGRHVDVRRLHIDEELQERISQTIAFRAVHEDQVVEARLPLDYYLSRGAIGIERVQAQVAMDFASALVHRLAQPQPPLSVRTDEVRMLPRIERPRG